MGLAAFSLVTIDEKRGDNDAVIKHLRDYIRTWGTKGGEDKLVIAHEVFEWLNRDARLQGGEPIQLPTCLVSLHVSTSNCKKNLWRPG